MQTNSYGFANTTDVSRNMDPRLLQLKHLGFIVLPGVLGEDILLEARKRLDAVYAIQERELGREYLAKINELNFARLPLSYDDWFVRLTVQPKVLEIVKLILGEYFILQLQNGIINMPGERHHQTSWHRDLPYQHWTSSQALAVNAMFCLDPFTVETGCTHVVPHSHHYEGFPGIEFMERNAVPAVAPAGSVIMFDSMLFHKAGNNDSSQVRRGINHLYTIPIIKQQIDFPRALGARYAEDPVFSRLFGYTSEPPTSVVEWRRQRHSRLIG